MTDITYDEWMNQTKKRFHRRSAELKRLDAAFKAFERSKGSGSSLQNLAQAFNIWVGIKGSDYLGSIRNRKLDASGVGPVEKLQSLIRTHRMSNIATIRTLHRDVPDRLVLDATLSANIGDKTKLRETYNRAKMAVHVARDTVLKAKTAGPEQTLYEKWFGTFESTRHLQVVKNFQGLCNLFDTGVIIVHDARAQMDAWGECFGFAMPGNKKNYVEFTVGRAFFLKTGYHVVPGATHRQRGQAVRQALKQAYKNTTDWTVGTMVHELGHATNNLPDVDFQAPNTYQVSPGGMTPDGWEQCSTPALDVDLALASPDLAIVNTDNYGQCAREALALKGR